jgi:hypothetical protein
VAAARRIAGALVSAAFLAASACSPSHANESVSGLSAPPTVAVVTTVPPPTILSLATHGSGADVRAQNGRFPATADFCTDPVNTVVFDRASDDLKFVNDLLCLLGQTQYAKLVNRGLYLAQIDQFTCKPPAVVNAVGQTRGFEDWLVASSRRRFEPQHVSLWVPTHDDGPGLVPLTVFASLDVTSPPSAANPFGLFTMNFAGTLVGGTPDVAQHCGQLVTRAPFNGRIGYDLFFLRGDLAKLPVVGDHHELLQVDVDLAADQLSGVAHSKKQQRDNLPVVGDTGVVTTDSRVAFDANAIVRSQNGGPTVTTSRTAFTIDELRYNLYDAKTGDRVALNTGAVVELVNGQDGFLDYYGLYVPPGATAKDGDVVHLVVNGVVDPNPLILRVAPGRLVENTRHSTLLISAVNEVFEWDEPFLPSGIGPNRYHLVCNGANFTAFEQFDFAQGVWKALANPFVVNVTTYGVLQMRSARFGGNVNYVDNATDVVWYTQRLVSGDPTIFPPASGGTLTLFAYFGGLQPSVTSTQANLGDVYFANSILSQPYTYQFHQTDLTLYYDNQGNLQPAGLGTGQAPTSGPFVGGMRSGPLVTTTAGFNRPEDVFLQPVVYTYETGANLWNEFTGLADPNKGTFLVFGQPLQFVYSHFGFNDANGDNAFDGQVYLLEYRGDGELHGIPTKTVDTDGDGTPDHDVPIFNILDGVLLGPNGNDFACKAVDVELMPTTLASPPPGLDPAAADALPLLDGSTYTTPSIGPVPKVSAPPAVVGGTIQGIR